jgi:uncharacterized DUF497 family protein
MKSDDFEWDDAKADSNYRRHKITFDQAREVFADPFIVEWIDDGSRFHASSASAHSAWPKIASCLLPTR